MISEIKDIFTMLYDLYKSSIEKKNDEFNNYLDEIFEKTKIIQKNYIDILSTVRYGVVYENWDGKETVKYLSKVEYELKSERVFIRESLKHINIIYKGELEILIRAIFSIMYCDYAFIGSQEKIEHRFTGLIIYAKEFQFSLASKELFIDQVNQMLDDVNDSWEIVCSTYFLLKEKYKK